MATPSSADAQLARPGFAAAREAILRELADAASSAVNAQFNAFTTRLADALLRASAQCAEPADAKRRADAAHLLKKNRYPFFYVAAARLAASLEQEIARAVDPSQAEPPASNARKPLAPDLEIDKTITLRKAARAMETEHAGALVALGLRLAHLLGRSELEQRQNPFRPQVFLLAIHDAWCEFQADAEAHHLIFPLLQPDLFLDLGPILHALNGTLARRGILPELPVSVDRAQRGVAPDDDDGALARELRRLLAGDPEPPAARRAPAGAFPALFGHEMVQAAAGRNALLAYLAGMRHARVDAQLLMRLRQDAPQDALTPADERVFDLLTKVFAAVFGDAHIPAEIKALIGSLQVPVLEAALTDRDFFFREDHPARRTIELLADLGVGWDRAKGAADPLHQAILRNVKRVQSDRRVAAFSDAVADLEAFLEKDHSASADGLAAPIAQALQHEKRLRAQQAAQQAVAVRISTGEVAAFVETFLEDKWVAVLTLAYSVADDKPQAVHSAVRTMDDLIWSVKPKDTQDERNELLARLPPLVAALNKWLDLIRWDGAQRKQFFAELAACHASIVRAPLDLSPRRRVELALSAAKQAARRRVAKPEAVPDAFAQQVQQLACGSWLAFTRKDGSTFRARLAWISPMRSLYVFATRERQEALSLSADMLAQALRCRRAQVILATGLVERALAAALGVDAANSDALAEKPAA